MSTLSPTIAYESHALEIPVFSNNTSRFRSLKRSYSDSFPSKVSYSHSLFQSLRLEKVMTSDCDCPHVLIADDDPFQGFYYQTLFYKSMGCETIGKSRLRLGVFRSGEELLEQYLKLQVCGCQSTTLIISDFQMGLDKLDGVETISTLRARGYDGPVILRTSEKKESLRKSHERFDEFMEKGFISCLLDKENHDITKSTIQSFLKLEAQNDCVFA